MIVRLYIKEQLLAMGQNLILDAKQSHYLGNVLRLKERDFFYVFDGLNGEYKAQIIHLNKQNVEIELVEKTREMTNVPDVWLLFAPLKKDKTDIVIQKATELGVQCIIPVRTAYTNTETVRLERFETQAIEAAEQCRRLDVPTIFPIVSMEKVLKDWDTQRTLFFLNERGNGEHILKAMECEKKAAILVGPEGGFSPEEVDKLSSLSFVKNISLGQRILRAETAVISALSCWQAVNGDW